MHADLCSCGEARDHEIARRQTLDGKTVIFWSDGMITWALGYRIRGVGRARYACVRRRDREAGWIVASMIELYESAEVPRLINAARTAVREPGIYAATDLHARTRQLMNTRRAPLV